MERNDEWQLMMQEREQMTEEAFLRAKINDPVAQRHMHPYRG